MGEAEMKKYILRFLVAILAFSIGTAIIYISVWDTITTSIPTQIVSPRKTIHSAENNSPYSVLEGTIIKIKPYDAAFKIPESWLSPKIVSGEPTKNLYLSWQDLNELEIFDSNHYYDFDKEYAQVMNSVIPFENCVAHIGDRAWGNGFTGDLQVRVFVVDINSEEITERIKKQGLNKAHNLFDDAKIVSEKYKFWEKQNLNVLEIGQHTFGNADIDFYYRPFGNKTVVFVFVHGWGWNETIEQMLDSFKWAN
jgi:hypothetical protein